MTTLSVSEARDLLDIIIEAVGEDILPVELEFALDEALGPVMSGDHDTAILAITITRDKE